MATVLISGANRGLGLEFVRQYAELGWQVLACCRTASDALTLVAAEHPDISVHVLDVSDAASVAALAAAVGDQPIDVLINNAGTYGRLSFSDGGIEHQAFGDSDFDNWEQVFRVNVFGPMRLSEALVDNVAASEQKKIVTLSSMLGSMGLNDIGGMYAYRTSKAAVNMLMHSMGIDLRKRGVLAVAVHPGWARTDMGGANAEVDPVDSVAGLIGVIDRLDQSDLGQLTAYDGSVLPY